MKALLPVSMSVALALCLATMLVGCQVQSSDGPVPTFKQINSKILEPNCTFACHSGGENAAGGLDLSKDPYRALINVQATAAACSGDSMHRIVPGDPDASLLYMKIEARSDKTDAPCGEVMPPGANNTSLTDEQIEMVRAWIDAGAPND